MRVIFAIFLSIHLIGCHPLARKPTPFSGTFPTIQIRQVWGHCLQVQSKSNPTVHPALNMALCDCFIDLTRKRYTHEGLKKSGEIPAVAINKMSAECAGTVFQNTMVPNSNYPEKDL